MKRPLFLGCWIFLGIAGTLQGAEPASSPIVIELKATGSASKRDVTLADVAELKGGSELMRQRLLRLDLAEMPGNGQPVTIKAKQIEFRIRLADVPPEAFRITGANQVMVSAPRESIGEEAVLRVARETLLKRLPYPAEDLTVKLVQPIVLQLPQAASWENPTIQAEPHFPQVRLGRCQIDVYISVNGERRLAMPVFLESQLVQQFAVVRGAIKKGETLTAQNLLPERRIVDPGIRGLLSYEAALGRKALQPLAAGQLVSSSYLEPEIAMENAVLIRAKQTVRMVVRLGTVNIIATGEAMQEGRLGQTIRVQNLDSKKVVAGRITGPGTIDVDTGVNP